MDPQMIEDSSDAVPVSQETGLVNLASEALVDVVQEVERSIQ